MTALSVPEYSHRMNVHAGSGPLFVQDNLRAL